MAVPRVCPNIPNFHFGNIQLILACFCHYKGTVSCRLCPFVFFIKDVVQYSRNVMTEAAFQVGKGRVYKSAKKFFPEKEE